MSTQSLALLRWPWRHAISKTPLMRSYRYPRTRPAPPSAFAGYRFPPEVITLAVRWYLRFGLSYRDVEELLAERGIEVDHVSVYRWVQRFAPEFAEAAGARRHVVGDRWHVNETYLKVGGTWRYLFRAIDQFGQVIDVFLSPRRNREAARRFFDQALGRTPISPVEVTTDRYRVYPRVLDELLPAAFHDTEVHANNPLETHHGRLKARLRPMRGLKRDRTARVIVAAHAFVQNVRRGFYDLGTEAGDALQVGLADPAHLKPLWLDHPHQVLTDEVLIRRRLRGDPCRDVHGPAEVVPLVVDPRPGVDPDVGRRKPSRRGEPSRAGVLSMQRGLMPEEGLPARLLA